MTNLMSINVMSLHTMATVTLLAGVVAFLAFEAASGRTIGSGGAGGHAVIREVLTLGLLLALFVLWVASA